LVTLNLKFCFLSFDDVYQLSNGIKFNNTIIKIDLGNNCIKPCTIKFFLEALLDNTSLADLRLSGNLLDNEFAVDLAHLLESNQTLHTVDISRNPIG
jgi:hypothetical protein